MALTTVSQHQIALTILLFTFLVAIKANSFCRTFLIAPDRGLSSIPSSRASSSPNITSSPPPLPSRVCRSYKPEQLSSTSIASLYLHLTFILVFCLKLLVRTNVYSYTVYTSAQQSICHFNTKYGLFHFIGKHFHQCDEEFTQATLQCQ